MENTKLHEENVKLSDLLNNINVSLYPIQNLDNIRIINETKPDFVILCSEVEATDNISTFFENEKSFQDKSKINFEGTFHDFYVINVNNENGNINALTISLFELIVSSLYLNIDDESKWSLEDTNFKLIELEFDFSEDLNDINNSKGIYDMKVMG